MFTVKAEKSVFEKLAALLREEDAGACIRLREYVLGGGWHAKRVLGPGTDQKDELEDVFTLIEGVPFIASESFLDTYGSRFELFMEGGMLRLKACEGEEKPQPTAACTLNP